MDTFDVAVGLAKIAERIDDLVFVLAIIATILFAKSWTVKVDK